MSLACILGCAGPRLGDEEARFFADADPWGFILFKRNIESAEQVRALTGALRTCVGRADAPILVDQEGGRVQRFGPPNWPVMPTARRIGALAERDLEAGRETAWLSGRLIAADLLDVGVTVDCAPVADLPTTDAHVVIGDRAYGEDPVLVATLARAMAEGLIAGGVMPIVKHIPGHGRAT
ncbi:MAG: glycoside hydrolase family 3 N-terminal domain-containing protein, partial [Caulobacteraceae bacterium]